MQGEKLRALRLQHGLTQAQFAERLGVHQSSIAKIEAGERGLTDAMRGRIAAHFDMGDEFLSFFARLKEIERNCPS